MPESRIYRAIFFSRNGIVATFAPPAFTILNRLVLVPNYVSCPSVQKQLVNAEGINGLQEARRVSFRPCILVRQSRAIDCNYEGVILMDNAGSHYCVRVPSGSVGRQHGFNPYPVSVVHQKDIWAWLGARRDSAPLGSIFLQRTGEVHFPEPGLEIAADLSQKVVIGETAESVPKAFSKLTGQYDLLIVLPVAKGNIPAIARIAGENKRSHMLLDYAVPVDSSMRASTVAPSTRFKRASEHFCDQMKKPRSFDRGFSY